MAGIITLTTDFGLSDAYVAAMKGVILGINPGVTLVDICHTIEPQNIRQAAFVLSTAHSYFPPNTVHLVVVDPGVGTRRRAIVVKTPQYVFVAPDNGVLSYVAKDKEYEAFAITKSGYWRTPVSPTFHGRDIFAPVAARLSLGMTPSDFGERLDSILVLSFVRPRVAQDGTLVGHVLHIDRFGNIITSIKASDLPDTRQLIKIEVNDRFVTRFVPTYGEGEGLVALIGSSGYLEIALRDGDASSHLNVKVGDEVKMKIGGK